MVPSPNWPEPLAPQHRTDPPATTQPWTGPMATAVAAVTPGTRVATGSVAPQQPRAPLAVTAHDWSGPVARSVTEPMASGAWTVAGAVDPTPQHCTVPSPGRTQVRPLPTASCSGAVTPVTVTGVALKGLTVPSPSWPTVLSPQHRSVPSVSSTQTWPPPVWRSTAPATPGTGVGVASMRSMVSGSPRPPRWFQPQQCTPPTVVRAQVCRLPSSMAATLESRTWVGWLRFTWVPSPTRPSSLLPQHRAVASLRRAQVV